MISHFKRIEKKSIILTLWYEISELLAILCSIVLLLHTPGGVAKHHMPNVHTWVEHVTTHVVLLRKDKIVFKIKKPGVSMKDANSNQWFLQYCVCPETLLHFPLLSLNQNKRQAFEKKKWQIYISGVEQHMELERSERTLCFSLAVLWLLIIIHTWYL